jgi:hypothetical protein
MTHPNYLTALDMLEHCRFVYRAYAQTCVYPMDPFFESHGEGAWQSARDRLMAVVHKERRSPVEARKFDPIEYDLEHTPHPRRGVVYRGGTGSEPFILFQPRDLDRAIGVAQGTTLTGEDTDCVVIADSSATVRCCHFQGMTGMTRTHPTAGWPTWLGACVYDPRAKTMVVAFRGSRSGSGGRALAQAQGQSRGNPDWVTDMNHLKGVAVKELGGATLSCGFWYAYESCKRSLEAAFYEALHHGELREVFFTGHSLGGALAQCAYVDMIGGTLLKGDAMDALKKKLSFHCYAMSAPPICLGEESAAIVDKLVGGARIYHFFAPKDSVHDSPEVAFSASSVASSMTATFTHPLTDPKHLGMEIKLPGCTESFPLAHEPVVVRKGIVKGIAVTTGMGYPADPGFWPLVELAPLVSWGPVVKDAGGLEDQLRLALGFSTSKKAAADRADLWSSVAKSKQASGYERIGFQEGEAFEFFEEACTLLHDLANPFGCDDRVDKTLKVKAIRAALLERYRGAGKHKASSGCLWTLLQHLSVRQYEWVTH